jgi:hypothetical protein
LADTYSACCSLQRADVVARAASPRTLVDKIVKYTQSDGKLAKAKATVEIAEEVCDVRVAIPLQQLYQQREADKREAQLLREADMNERQADKKDRQWQLALVLAAVLLKGTLPLASFWQFVINLISKP